MIDRFVTWLAQSPEYGVKYHGGIYMRSLNGFMCFLAGGLIAALIAGCGSGGGDSVSMAPPDPPGAAADAAPRARGQHARLDRIRGRVRAPRPRNLRRSPTRTGSLPGPD